MSEIKKGDWVMVAYGLPCCGNGVKFGHTFIVDRLISDTNHSCDHCNAPISKITAAIESGESAGFIVERLKRIDPPALPESVEHKESLTA